MNDSMRIMLGQRLAVGFDGGRIPAEYAALVKRCKVGNAILFRRNVESFEQLRALCAGLRELIRGETGCEPFIMIDEECGSVSRLAHIAGQTPCAMAIGATGDPENAYCIGRLVGEELRAVGINFNLAPVLDCLTDPDNSVGGNRIFACAPDRVAEMGVRYIQGLQGQGVFACGKHFPGHGDTSVDSHLALPVVDKTLEAMRQTELVSFEAAIRAGIEGIMSAHVAFPAIEPRRLPATVSRRVMTGLLRQEMGFKGIIVSDSMEMKAVMEHFGVEDGTRMALEAGVDVALVSNSVAQAFSVCERLYRSVDDGGMDEGEIEAHCRRIASAKARLKSVGGDPSRFGSEQAHTLSRQIMAQAVRVLYAPQGQPLPKIDNRTLFIGTSASTASRANDAIALDGAAHCAGAFGAVGAEAPGEGALRSADTIVAILGRGAVQSPCFEAVRRLAGAGKKVVAVSMHTPRCLDFLPDNVWKVCSWQYDTLALEALIGLLKRK